MRIRGTAGGLTAICVWRLVFMKDVVKALEGLPWIIRVLLTIIWGAYSNVLRLCRSLAKGNVVGIVLAVILLLCGGFVVLWIFDIICVVLGRRIWWID